MEAPLVCAEGRDVSVVSEQAGGSEAGLAAEKGGRLVNTVTPQLETPLVCPASEQTYILRQRC